MHNISKFIINFKINFFTILFLFKVHWTHICFSFDIHSKLKAICSVGNTCASHIRHPLNNCFILFIQQKWLTNHIHIRAAIVKDNLSCNISLAVWVCYLFCLMYVCMYIACTQLEHIYNFTAQSRDKRKLFNKFSSRTEHNATHNLYSPRKCIAVAGAILCMTQSHVAL